VSADVIGMIISLFAFAVAMLGGVGWMISRQTRQMDYRFDQVDRRFEQVDRRFEQVDHRFEQVDHRFERLETRMDRLENRMDRMESETSRIGADLVGVKVAIARWEGPEKHLQRL